jgi:hypothetical protein
MHCNLLYATNCRLGLQLIKFYLLKVLIENNSWLLGLLTTFAMDLQQLDNGVIAPLTRWCILLLSLRPNFFLCLLLQRLMDLYNNNNNQAF